MLNRFVAVYIYSRLYGGCLYSLLWKNQFFGRVCLPVYLSVCPFAWNNLNLTGRFLMKFGICVHVKNMSRKNMSRKICLEKMCLEKICLENMSRKNMSRKNVSRKNMFRKICLEKLSRKNMSRKNVQKIKISLIYIKITVDILHRDQYTFLIIMIIFFHGLGRLTCSGIDALPTFLDHISLNSS